ncbi:MAG: hypothetical protein Q8S02_04780, partial [Hydrogenophaga sp.]|nr:hypothetical protein [Hydrogenophaga sp.]
MPTASAFVASDAAAVDKAPPRTPDLIASGAPVTHPALRAAWITGRPFHADRGQCRYHPSVTQRFAQLPAIGVERCPRSAWNAARHRLEWVPAISGIRTQGNKFAEQRFVHCGPIDGSGDIGGSLTPQIGDPALHHKDQLVCGGE